MRIVLTKGRLDGVGVAEVQVHLAAFGRRVVFVLGLVIPTALKRVLDFAADVSFIGTDKAAVRVQAFGVGAELGAFWGSDAAVDAVEFDPLGFDAEAAD